MDAAEYPPDFLGVVDAIGLINSDEAFTHHS
jgi:hypothetical protein